MENLLENLNLSGDEDDELIIGEEGIGDQQGSSELCMVGRFLTDQSINFTFTRSRLASIWKPQSGVSIKEIGNGRFLFQFYHKIDLKRVLEGGPWSIGSHPLLVHHLKLGEISNQVPLNTLGFWVQIYNMPMGSFSEAVGRSLGNFIGRFLEYDPSHRGAAWRNFMRIQVELDVTQPLKKGKKIKVGSGEPTMVTFKYERLNIFCFICGKLGHTESFCDILFNSQEEVVTKGWGTFLKAPDRRSRPMEGDKWLREVSSTGAGKDGDVSGGSEDMVSGREDSLFIETVAGRSRARVYPENIGTIKEVVADSMPQFEGRSLSNNGMSLVVNPCFEEGASKLECEDDEITLNEIKRRKRRMHEEVGRNGAIVISENEHAAANQIMFEGSTQHFLSAGPGSRACRE